VVAGFAEDMDLDISAEAKRQGFGIRSVAAMRRSIHPVRDAKALLQLIWIIGRGRYDLVHTHTSKAGVLGRLAACICGVPRVVHSPHGSVLFGYFNKRTTQIFAFLERLVSPLADRLICLTRFEIGEYARARIGRPSHYVVIPNGIDIDSFRGRRGDREALRESLDLSKTGLVFISVGRLVPIKGFVDLIRAVRLVVDAGYPIVLLLLGEGELREDLEAEARRLGIEKNIRFLGWRDDVPELMDAADAFVLASHNEGLGLVLVEAMSKGLPVVATRVGGIPDVVQDGATGHLVPPESPNALSQAMLKLIEDPWERKRMGEAGRRRADSRFSIDATVQLTQQLYEELLSGSRRNPRPLKEVR